MLSKLIKTKAPNGVIVRKIKDYQGAKIAIDASLSMYQFLIAVRSETAQLQYTGSDTSHLSGFFYRTIKMVEAGITPVYVFDGQSPENKIFELEKRTQKREKADAMLQKAIEAEDQKSIIRYEKMKVKMTSEHIEDTKKLLELMGIPYVTGVSEAEAYCAYLCKNGIVKAVATEDMDALCFGANLVVRNMNASKAKNVEIEEYNLSNILKELDLSMESFIDLCILMGCDFCDTLRNIGPKRGYDLIKKYGTIEKILENNKIDVSEKFDYVGARKIFNELGNMGEDCTFKIDYDRINIEKLVEFMVGEKGFNEKRITIGMERMMKNKKTNGSQMRLDTFFR